MTATRTAPAPYRSGLCSTSLHERCRGAYSTAVCDCACHQKAVVDDPPAQPESSFAVEDAEPPSTRLTRAAAIVSKAATPTGTPDASLPPSVMSVLAGLLSTEATWAADRPDTYPTDRAPLLQLADLIIGDLS